MASKNWGKELKRLITLNLLPSISTKRSSSTRASMFLTSLSFTRNFQWIFQATAIWKSRILSISFLVCTSISARLPEQAGITYYVSTTLKKRLKKQLSYFFMVSHIWWWSIHTHTSSRMDLNFATIIYHFNFYRMRVYILFTLACI